MKSDYVLLFYKYLVNLFLFIGDIDFVLFV